MKLKKHLVILVPKEEQVTMYDPTVRLTYVVSCAEYDLKGVGTYGTAQM